MTCTLCLCEHDKSSEITKSLTSDDFEFCILPYEITSNLKHAFSLLVETSIGGSAVIMYLRRCRNVGGENDPHATKT